MGSAREARKRRTVRDGENSRKLGKLREAQGETENRENDEVQDSPSVEGADSAGR
jgi:hypothetical protein